MSICPCWLDVMYQPRSSMCTTRISLCFMLKRVLLASSRRLNFVITLELNGKSLPTVKGQQMPSVSYLSESGMFF